MAITLPGYQPVYADRVFEKPDKSPNRKIITLCRYTESYEEDVVSYIQQKLMELSPMMTPKFSLGAAAFGGAAAAGPVSAGLGQLEDMLIRLPDKVKSDILSEDEEIVDSIKGSTHVLGSIKGQAPCQFMVFHYGLIPVDVIRNYKERGAITQPEWYDAALMHIPLQMAGFGLKLRVHLQITNETLPDRETLAFLMSHDVHGSRTFEVNRLRYNAQELSGLLDIVYAGLKTPAQMKQVHDVSMEVLEAAALPAAAALKQRFAAEAGSAGIPGAGNGLN
ncbi:MAG TPA: hypothetical protein HA362_07635 [Nanoarchaeota archaeon]|nr:hypothetical protein [Nanoarchaeota archaeon]